jgi:hypothetical protein
LTVTTAVVTTPACCSKGDALVLSVRLREVERRGLEWRGVANGEAGAIVPFL